MKRTLGVTLAAVVALLGSLLALVMGLLGLVAALLVPTAASSNSLARWGLYLGVAVLAGAGIWGLITSIGLFRLRRWARYSTLVFSGIAVFFSASGLLMFAVLPAETFSQRGDQAVNIFWVILWAIYGLPLLIGGWWLVLFNRASVKSQFAGESQPSVAWRGPISIQVIAWFLLIAGLLTLGCAFFGWPGWFLGWMLTGWKAASVYLLVGIAQMYLGWGLLRLTPHSRTICIYFQLFALVNILLFLFLPGWEERVAASIAILSPDMRAQVQGSPLTNQWWLSLFFALGGPVAILWFLIREKAAFEPKAPEPASGPSK